MTRIDGGAGVIRLEPSYANDTDFAAMAKFHATADGGRPGAMSAAQDDLEHRLGLIVRAHADCDIDGIILSARRIRHLALQLGFLELRRATDNAIGCCRDGDATALAAVIGRIDRLGAMALAQVDLITRSVT